MYRLVQRRGIIGLFCLLFVASSVVPGWAQKDNRFEVSKNLDIFNSLLKEVEMFYVDSVDVDKTVQRGIEAMLAGLDPYTEYYPEQKTEELSLMTTGEYGGIGLVLKDHLWEPNRNWGYIQFNTSAEATAEAGRSDLGNRYDRCFQGDKLPGQRVVERCSEYEDGFDDPTSGREETPEVRDYP
jgi:hypothetical protein